MAQHSAKHAIPECMQTNSFYRTALCSTLSLLLGALLTACAAVPLSKPIAPTVSVAAVKPLNFSLTSQKLAFTLRVNNPNSFDLPMESLTFSANLGGEHLAQGSSVNKVTIPAKGEAMLNVTVEAGLSKIINKLDAILKQQATELDYDVTGVVKLANWPANIPFNVEGELEDPLSNIQQ